MVVVVYFPCQSSTDSSSLPIYTVCSEPTMALSNAGHTSTSYYDDLPSNLDMDWSTLSIA
eukprot:12276317-Ditylum_brightwellii.AAC.1